MKINAPWMGFKSLTRTGNVKIIPPPPLWINEFKWSLRRAAGVTAAYIISVV